MEIGMDIMHSLEGLRLSLPNPDSDRIAVSLRANRQQWVSPRHEDCSDISKYGYRIPISCNPRSSLQ